MAAMIYFPCYHAYLDKTRRLSDAELGQLFRALMVFSATGEVTELDGLAGAAFDFISADIVQAKEKYEEKCDKARKAAEKRYSTGACEGMQTHADVADACEGMQNKNKNKNKNNISPNGDIGNLGEKSPTRARFVPPTVEEVQDYCQERNNRVDASRFIDYYTSNGWKVGRQSMKDWKAAVRTWEKNGFDGFANQKPMVTGNPFEMMLLEMGN